MIIREKKSLGPAYRSELVVEFEMLCAYHTAGKSLFFVGMAKRQDLGFILTGDSV